MNKKGDKRVVHRNLLMKCNDLPLKLFEQADNPQRKNKQSKTQLPDVDSSGDEEFDILITYPRHYILEGGEDRIIDESDVIEENIDESDVIEEGNIEESDVIEDRNVDESNPSSDEETFLGFEDESEDDASEEESSSLRRSSRVRTRRKIFTYHDVGGNPLIE